MNYKKSVFITAIGTDSGKTLASAVLCKALKYDYWKPIQCGMDQDSQVIQKLSPDTVIQPEWINLKTAASPHQAAEIEKIKISLREIDPPLSKNPLVIEGAGGVLVPTNQNQYLIDWVIKKKIKIVLVCNYYLGSINHSLLTYEYLKMKKANIKGVIFNGEDEYQSRKFLIKKMKLPILVEIPRLSKATAQQINALAKKVRYV